MGRINIKRAQGHGIVLNEFFAAWQSCAILARWLTRCLARKAALLFPAQVHVTASRISG
ncbi:hypothetical protein Z949_708 [Sulfitobacter guttiformis KCTC 32187]|nr:hypothetical protein Z949_708 [Sulfitobacter guttiformis KCTC 32187]